MSAGGFGGSSGGRISSGGFSGGRMSSGGLSGSHMSGGSHAFSGQSQFSHPGHSSMGLNHGQFQTFGGQHHNWNHNWAGNNHVWDHNQAWRGHHEPDRHDFFRFGVFGWPWFAFNWGPGYWWPNYYDYGYAPYGDIYGGYGPNVMPYATAYVPSDDAAVPPETGDDASAFYAQGLAAFRQGDYGNATRLAGHAAIDDPRNPDVHILTMLGLFAMGEYRGAAMEAHAVAALGRIPDWQKLYGFYGNLEPYTEHLRKLEKFVNANLSAPEGRFLLGFQYLMEGHKDAAKGELLHALKLTPRDPLAAKLLTQAGGTVPADIAPQLSQQAPKAPDSPAPASPATPPAPPQP